MNAGRLGAALLVAGLGVACGADVSEGHVPLQTSTQAVIPYAFPPPLAPTWTTPSTVSLTAATLDEFIDYVESSRPTQQQAIRVAINGARCSPTGPCPIVDGLITRVTAPAKLDTYRLLVTLKILGELADARSIAPLVSYINDPLPNESEPGHQSGELSVPETRAGLKARAVEVVGFVATPAALSAVLSIAANHPWMVVRDAAVASYLYNSADKVAARSALLGVLAVSDRLLVDRFAKTATMTQAEWTAKDAAFQAAWPYTPPLDVSVAPGTPPGNQSPSANPPVFACYPNVNCTP